MSPTRMTPARLSAPTHSRRTTGSPATQGSSTWSPTGQTRRTAGPILMSAEASTWRPMLSTTSSPLRRIHRLPSRRLNFWPTTGIPMKVTLSPSSLLMVTGAARLKPTRMRPARRSAPTRSRRTPATAATRRSSTRSPMERTRRTAGLMSMSAATSTRRRGPTTIF